MQPFTFSLLIWYIFPIIAIFGAKFIVSFFRLNYKFQLKAPDLATFFLIIGIHNLSRLALGSTLLPYYFISIILLGMGLAFVHAYFFDDIHYGRWIKMYWRMVFLFTIFIYSILIVLDILSFLV